MKVLILADQKSLNHFPSGKTLLEGCVEMFQSLVEDSEIVVQCPQEICPRIKELAVGATIYAEPVGRGTAPAIGLSAVRLALADPSESFLIAYSDHPVSYRNNLFSAVKLVETLRRNLNRLLLIGVNPTFPAIEYGYIKIGEVLQEVNGSIAFEVVEFNEKPSLELADQYIQSWRYLWNTGYTVTDATELLDLYRQYLPDLYRGLMTIKESIGTNVESDIIQTVYNSFPKISIDKGVYEKIDPHQVGVVPVDLHIHDFESY